MTLYCASFLATSVHLSSNKPLLFDRKAAENWELGRIWVCYNDLTCQWTSVFYEFKNKLCMFYSFTRSDQPGSRTITRDNDTKHLLLTASRLQCDMFSVLSSLDVWPTLIHFKHLACVATSLLLKPFLALAFSISLCVRWVPRLIPFSSSLLHSSSLCVRCVCVCFPISTYSYYFQ